PPVERGDTAGGGDPKGAAPRGRAADPRSRRWNRHDGLELVESRGADWGRVAFECLGLNAVPFRLHRNDSPSRRRSERKEHRAATPIRKGIDGIGLEWSVSLDVAKHELLGVTAALE